MKPIEFQKFLNKEPKYRFAQAKKAIFQDLIRDWQEAKALPQGLREELNKNCPIETLKKVFIAKDKNVIKAAIVLKDNLKVETVLMRHKDKRNTVCLSSQVGCLLACSFCSTGKMGFKRNLEAWEIIEQVLFFARYLKKTREKISNLVFMGMGEPFLNYQNVIEAVKILNDKEGFNFGSRHFSISTAGVVEGIEKLAEEKLQINLAISLHAPNDELRSRLMPINKKYPIKKVLKAVDCYIEKTNRRVMFEYLMIKNLNDSEKDGKSLAVLMKKPLYFVNLISYNFIRRLSGPSFNKNGSFSEGGSPALLAGRPGKGGPAGVFRPSSSLKIKNFKEALEKEGIKVTQRHRFGQKIGAACGQLVR